LYPVLERGRVAGVRFLAAVVVCFPEMNELVLQYLRERR